MDELRQKLDELRSLNRSRYDYVIARAECKSKEDAFRQSGCSKQWFYGFSEVERDELERLAHELHHAKVMHAALILEDATVKAAQVKVEGLRGIGRQETASEILNGMQVWPKKQSIDINLHVDGLDQILGAVYGSSNGTEAGTDQD